MTRTIWITYVSLSHTHAQTYTEYIYRLYVTNSRLLSTLFVFCALLLLLLSLL